MRSFRGWAGEKGFASALGSAWTALLAWIVGSVGQNNIWKFGPLTKGQAHSLDKAILVIGIPPVLFFIGIFYYIYRRRASWHGKKGAEAASDLDSASS